MMFRKVQSFAVAASLLDDSIVHLKPGDTIVQQATNHPWVNHGTETCRILFVLMDSKQQ